MGSKPSEFRARSRKTITLPSGLIVDIRKIWAYDFIELGELPLPQGENREDRDPPALGQAGRRAAEIDTRRYACHAIIKGSLSPRFSVDPADRDNPDLVHVEDLSQEDMEALSSAILKWAGLTQEVAAVAESFRGNGIGADRGDSGGDVRETSDRDLKPQSG